MKLSSANNHYITVPQKYPIKDLWQSSKYVSQASFQALFTATVFEMEDYFFSFM